MTKVHGKGRREKTSADSSDAPGFFLLGMEHMEKLSHSTLWPRWLYQSVLWPSGFLSGLER